MQAFNMTAIDKIRSDTFTLYLEYLNNFLTVERFAEYYDLSVNQARVLIDLGRQFHEESSK